MWSESFSLFLSALQREFSMEGVEEIQILQQIQPKHSVASLPFTSCYNIHDQVTLYGKRYFVGVIKVTNQWTI